MRLFLLLFVLAPATAMAATTYSGTRNISTVIPDNDDAGFTDSQDLGIPSGETVTAVSVDLTFTGGWNGDLYAYLIHDSGFSVLLNRVGRSLSSPDGAGSSGMNVTIADSAASDIHTAIPMSGGSVSGTFQPDARTTDPHAVLDTDVRTAMLSSFNDVEGSGLWTLFVADQAAGDSSTLQSWGLSVTTSSIPVPEPGSTLLAALGLITLFRRRRINPAA